jgi:hypothetical protein
MISLMHLALRIYFLTLVVSAAGAAPDNSLRPEQIFPKTQQEATKRPVEKETVQASPSPTGRTQRLTWNPVRASNNLGIGLASGALDAANGNKNLASIHFQRTQYNMDEGAQEFGLGLLGTSYLSVDLGYKQGCCFNSWVRTWDPFYKWSAAGLFDPKDQIGNLIDYKRYFFQASVGFESLFESRRSWRLEAGGRYGHAGLQFFLQTYLAFPEGN